MIHPQQTPQALTSLLAQPGKLAVLDFTAAWCGPCKQVKPKIEVMSNKYPDVLFATVDVDEMQEAAKEWGIKAMPTFVIVKEGKEVKRIQGADPKGVEEAVIQASKDMPKSSSGGASGQMNLSSYIDSSQLHGLNVDSRFPVTSVIGAEKPIKSDTDEQVIIVIPFRQKVKIHSIKISGPKNAGPKHVKLFVDKMTLGFEDSGMASTQDLDLEAEDLKADGAPNILKFLSFQKVESLALFIDNNQGGEDVTVIDEVVVYGQPVESTGTGKIEKISHDH